MKQFCMQYYPMNPCHNSENKCNFQDIFFAIQYTAEKMVVAAVVVVHVLKLKSSTEPNAGQTAYTEHHVQVYKRLVEVLVPYTIFVSYKNLYPIQAAIRKLLMQHAVQKKNCRTYYLANGHHHVTNVKCCQKSFSLLPLR